MTPDELRELIREQWKVHGLGVPTSDQMAAVVNVAFGYAIEQSERAVEACSCSRSSECSVHGGEGC